MLTTDLPGNLRFTIAGREFHNSAVEINGVMVDAARIVALAAGPSDGRKVGRLWVQRLKALLPKSLSAQERENFVRLDRCISVLRDERGACREWTADEVARLDAVLRRYYPSGEETAPNRPPKP